MEITQEFDLMKILIETDRNLRILKSYSNNGRNSITLNIEADWVTPFHLLAISALSRYYGLKIVCKCKSNVKSYLNRISFPEGTRSVSTASGTALPLTRLNSRNDDDVLGKYEDQIINKVDSGLRSNFRNNLKYMTSELVTNVREHAKVDNYWLLAQHWPRTDTCKIAIADTGVGYLNSYKGTSYEVTTHHEAIQNALEGNSSKDWIERGAGVPSTVRIFTEGYGGTVVVITGDAIRIIRGGKSERFRLNSFWPGTLIGIRFNLKNVNIYPYLSGY